MSGGEDRDQDVRSGEGGERGTVEDREEEEPEDAEAAEGGGQGRLARRRCGLKEEVQNRNRTSRFAFCV